MNCHEAFESGWMPDLEWKSLLAFCIFMTGAKRLTLTSSGIAIARTLTVDVRKDDHGNVVFEAVHRPPNRPADKKAA